MDQYLQYNTEDFLLDEAFMEWVKRPSPATNEQWNEWLQQHPEKRHEVEEAKKMLALLDFSDQEAFSGDEIILLKDEIDSAIENQRNKKPFILRRLSPALKIAAAFLGVIITAGLIFYLSRSGNPELITIATNYAERKVVQLPDGSEVVLNANSSVSYKSNWSEHHREIWMKGENYFRVKHIEPQKGAARKFTVHASHIDVEVLGTEFNVSDEDSVTSVLLSKGKVLLTAHATRQQVMMRPNDLATYRKHNRTLENAPVNPHRYLAWMQGKYIFDKATVLEICNHLQRFYGTEFIIRNKTATQQLYSGAIDLHNEQSAINTLSVIFNTKVTKENSHIVIH